MIPSVNLCSKYRNTLSSLDDSPNCNIHDSEKQIIFLLKKNLVLKLKNNLKTENREQRLFFVFLKIRSWIWDPDRHHRIIALNQGNKILSVRFLKLKSLKNMLVQLEHFY